MARQHFNEQRTFRTFTESQWNAALAALSSWAFIIAPIAIQEAASANWQQDLYQWAYQRAQAVVRPSWIERDVLAVWN